MSAENVLVVGRCRPFNEKEKQAGHTNITQIDTKNGSIKLQNPKNPSDAKMFSFDAMFDETCTQMQVYNATAKGIVDAALNGYNGTVFVYGQTGTGKTFSMQGIPKDPVQRGIIPTCFHQIFDFIARTGHKKFLVRVSFLEIYNEEVKDLLIKSSKNPKGGLDLKENPETGVFVKDLSAVVVKSVEELEKLMDVGNANRSVGETLMNAQSSRSHSIFTITIESSEPGPDGEEKYVSGKLNLVDLAGSERQSKTGATGDRLKEATKINLSLSALGNCISALVDGKSSHIPYRDSKLTRLLQDSLGGNAKTLMIATLSPASYNFEETLSTLRYANRAKSIKNKPVINEDPKDAMLREYQNEIERLKLDLQSRLNGGVRVVKKVVKKTVVKKVKKPKSKLDLEDQGDAFESEDGEESEDDAESGEDVGRNTVSGLDPETIAQLQAEVEAEKAALLASKDMVVEERQKLAAELEKRAADLEKEKQERELLAIQLRAMEAKLLIGGVNIQEKISEQERELMDRESRIEEENRKKRLLEKRLESNQEAQLQLEERFSSLQEEVDVKTKKLDKLFAKLQEVKEEIGDLQDEFRVEKEDILDTIRDLSKELQLKLTIIENFIPPEEVQRLEGRVAYDQESDEWVLQKVIAQRREMQVPRPVSFIPHKRPISKYAKIAMAMGDPNPRWRPDNILTLQLELPERTTLQNEAPRKGGTPLAALQGALDYSPEGEDVAFSSRDLNGDSIYFGSQEVAEERLRSAKGSRKVKSGRVKQ
ncbi:Kinesin-like protein kif3b [Kappamyces sp. JEL0829]|nr:Kinesin-like protein kif3b [Kappamyces sp. JEL0829]